MEESATPVVAVRRLHDMDDPQAAIEITLYAPTPVSIEREWLCGYRITGLDSDITGNIPGIDAMQALLLALDAIRRALDVTKRRFSWVGGKEDTGFYRVVTNPFGAEFGARLNHVVDGEIARFSQELAAKHGSSRSQ